MSRRSTRHVTDRPWTACSPWSMTARNPAASDDAEGADPRVTFTLPRDGVYHLSLIDAHDQGGPAFVYRLLVR